MDILRQIKALACASLSALGVAMPAMAAPIVYMTGTFDPWGITTPNPGSNETAMDIAFGLDHWSKSQGFSMAAFGADTTFLFLDGSHLLADQFSSFLAANQAALTTYVSNGGTLMLNSAPTQGGSFTMGFGATLRYDGGSKMVMATSAGAASGIFANLPTAYYGSNFSHASITGGLNYISLLDDTHGNSVFGVQKVGNGMVGLGGMTLPFFHSPAADSRMLLANMLTYVDTQGNAGDVPEPGSMVLVGLGLASAALVRRRKA